MSLWRVSWRATEKLWFYSEKWFTVWWSNIAMENGLFSSMIYDELPTKIVWRLWFSTGTLNQELVIFNGEIMQILRWTGDWVGVIRIQLMINRGSNQMGIYKEFSSLVSSGIFFVHHCSSIKMVIQGLPYVLYRGDTISPAWSDDGRSIQHRMPVVTGGGFP